MNRNKFFLLIILTVIFSCNPDGKDKDKNNEGNSSVGNEQNFIFSASVNKTDWKAKNAFYENQDNSLIITAISDNYEKLFITVDNDKNGTYKLDNRTFFVNDNGTYYAKSGSVSFTKDKNDLISGTFNIELVNSLDSSTLSISDGEFKMISSEKQLKQNNNIITTSKIMEIDVNEGTIKNENKKYEISYKNNVLMFKSLDDIKESFSIKIAKKEINSTASVYYSSDPSIDYIFVDALKNQVTIFYKKGVNKSFLN